MEVLNVWCSLLHFCLLSLIQTTSQWIRIYCCFVFWEKTVAWEKIPKSAVWAPRAAPLASQMCCHRWALHWRGWASCLHRWSDQILTCCTKPIHQVLPESRVDGKAAAESSELCLFCLEMPSRNSARSHHKGHIWHIGYSSKKKKNLNLREWLFIFQYFCGIFVGKLYEVELFCRYRIWNISSEWNFIYTRTVMTRFKVKFWCVAN